MKNTYIFLLLVCLTFNSFGKSHTTLNNTSVNSNNIYIRDTEPSMTNSLWTLSAEKTIISKEGYLIEFKNNQRTNRTETILSQNLYFNPSDKNQQINNKTNSDDRLKIRLEFYTSANFHREILLTIDDRSTDDIDKGFDAYLFDEHPNDMYWMLGDDKLIIQAFNELPIDRVVPIGITSMGDCSLQIKVTTLENPYPGMEVYLRDNNTMDTYDIINGIFEVTLEEGQFNDKYSIVFEPKTEIKIENELVSDEVANEIVLNEVENEEVLNKVLVFVGEHNDLLRIRKTEKLTLTNIYMFNMLGQQIKVWNSNLNKNEIDLPIHAKKGVHLVVMNTNKGRVMKKVIIK